MIGLCHTFDRVWNNDVFGESNTCSCNEPSYHFNQLITFEIFFSDILFCHLCRISMSYLIYPALHPYNVQQDANSIGQWIVSFQNETGIFFCAGEIYLAFFNLYNQRNRISAKVEDFAEVLKGNFSINCSYDGEEIWTGKQFHMLSGTVSMMVEKHGSVLFVLTCH